MKTEPKIMQHCFGSKGSGGPVIAFERLVQGSKLNYGLIRQEEAAGGISFRLISRFIREINVYKPDLIHVRGLGNEGFHAVVAARIAGVKKILVSIHGTQRDLIGSRASLRRFIVSYVLEPLTLLMATHVATVCEFAAKRDFLKAYKKKLIGVVPNGVSVPSLPINKGLELRMQFGLHETTPIAICVARITIEKGFLVLAEALKQLDANGHSFALVVVGGGDESHDIRQAFDGLKKIRVFFVGHQSDVRYFLAQSDFFIFPSFHENLSNALIEAMAFGLPVIASSVGGNVEVINRGGGILVPAGNPKVLSEAISQILNDTERREMLGVEAYKNIVENYAIDKMILGWEQLYAGILGEI